MKKLLSFCAVYMLLSSCATQNKIGIAAKKNILTDSVFAPAHVGISIYNPSTNKYLYNYQGDKYFVPASNTKLLTCYAAMKHLGDSLVGLRYRIITQSNSIAIAPTADPTLLHPDFKYHNVFEFLKDTSKIYMLANANWNVKPFGKGWAWDDYSSDYMAERSFFPVYGNVVNLKVNADTLTITPNFQLKDGFTNPTIDDVTYEKYSASSYSYRRDKNSNYILYDEGKKVKFKEANIPFITSPQTTKDILKQKISGLRMPNYIIDKLYKYQTIHSQPTDSLLKLMMHRSDNFFAEQSLLMVSNEMLGVMNDEKIIDSLLQTDFKDLPQKPKWVDGSGLSRYNLITPQDFVAVLAKMKNEFSWDRITTILPTGGEGTISSYFKNYAGKIYAKTGTLSNHVSLSGYIITKKNKTLIFSVLVNAHQTSATTIRKAVEKFISEVIENN